MGGNAFAVCPFWYDFWDPAEIKSTEALMMEVIFLESFL